jgi:predicted ribosomally synthesized peptide with nif11-like leader
MAKGLADFRAAVAGSKELQEAFVAAGQKGGAAAIVALASGRGYEFTVAELEQAGRDSELNDLELELVAAAGGQQCNNNMV